MQPPSAIDTLRNTEDGVQGKPVVISVGDILGCTVDSYPDGVDYISQFTEMKGLTYKYEYNNDRIKILKINDVPGVLLQHNLGALLTEARKKVDFDSGVFPKVMVRIPNIPALVSAFVDGGYVDGTGYIPVVEEKTAAAHFKREDGVILDGVTIAWYPEKIVRNVKNVTSKIDKEIQGALAEEGRFESFTDKLDKGYRFKLATNTKFDRELVSSIMNRVYFQWCSSDPMRPQGVAEMMDKGARFYFVENEGGPIGCLSAVPEAPPYQHYSVMYNGVKYVSNAVEITDGGILPEFTTRECRKRGEEGGFATALLDFVLKDLIGTVGDHVIFSEASYPFASKSFLRLKVPTDARGVTVSRPEYSGTLSHHVIIKPKGCPDFDTRGNYSVFRVLPPLEKRGVFYLPRI